MATSPDSTGLPQAHAFDVQILRQEPHYFAANTAASHLVGYIASGATDTARAERMEQVRDALGKDEIGRDSFATILRGAQAPVIQDGLPMVGQRFHAAFQKMVDDGRWSAADTRALVGLEAHLGGNDQASVSPGTPGPTMATVSARQSSYFESLGSSPAQAEVRAAFVSESLSQAAAVAQTRPSTSEHLYAQAAQVLANESSREIKSQLTALAAHDPDGVARFALGATGGMADRAGTFEFATVGGHVTYPANGLPRIMDKLTEDVRVSAAAGRPDRDAESLLAQTVTGSLRYGTIARGTDAEKTLLQNDERTGFRDALNGAMRADFNAILRANAYRDGDSLSAEGGYDTFSNYTRYQFSAPNDAFGRRTAHDAQEILADKLGTLEGDLLKAARDGGGDLKHDFGAGTFGTTARAQQDGAHVLGALFGSIRNGLNTEFDVRADRAHGDRRETQELFHRTGEIAELAGKVASRVGGEAAAGVLETVGGVAKSLEDNTPLQATAVNARTAAFDAIDDRFGSMLATGRPGTGMRESFGAGESEANTQWARYEADHDHLKVNEAAAESQRGLIAQGLLHIVPSPETVTPSSHSETSNVKQTEERLEKAVHDFNAGGHGRTLPPPTHVGAWDGTNRTGTALRLGEDEYAISTGKGGYQTFSVDRTNGVHPVPDQPIDLRRDGTIHQAFAHVPQQR